MLHSSCFWKYSVEVLLRGARWYGICEAMYDSVQAGTPMRRFSVKPNSHERKQNQKCASPAAEYGGREKESRERKVYLPSVAQQQRLGVIMAKSGDRTAPSWLVQVSARASSPMYSRNPPPGLHWSWERSLPFHVGKIASWQPYSLVIHLLPERYLLSVSRSTSKGACLPAV